MTGRQAMLKANIFEPEVDMIDNNQTEPPENERQSIWEYTKSGRDLLDKETLDALQDLTPGKHNTQAEAELVKYSAETQECGE